MNAIDNLNKVQETRDFLIHSILMRDSNGLSNFAYEKLEQSLNKKSFKQLDNRMTKLNGDWRKTYNI